ncbi:MAG: HAD-IA family hydrolase [Kiritimatiellaeota bacterium]|nr:HAD-IA family hydrolase [Kiritimatiellota bacterium]
MKTPGAIFDWDGVVVQSGAWHVASWAQLAAEEHRPAPDVPGLGGLGLKGEHVITELLRWTREPAEIQRLLLRKEDLFRDRIARGGLAAVPGVIAFLRALQTAGIPAAVGSSAPRRNIDVCAAALGLAGYFAAIVAAEDVRRGKPDPEVFLQAAARLGCAPRQCVVFEDAPAGVAAARAAGMICVGVLTTRSRAELPGVDRYIRSFDELTAAEVAALAAGGKPNGSPARSRESRKPSGASGVLLRLQGDPGLVQLRLDALLFVHQFLILVFGDAATGKHRDRCHRTHRSNHRFHYVPLFPRRSATLAACCRGQKCTLYLRIYFARTYVAPRGPAPR